MRGLVTCVVVMTLSTPLKAQDVPRWEYGRLSITIALGLPAPVAWSAGDSTVNSSALVKAVSQHERDVTPENRPG